MYTIVSFILVLNRFHLLRLQFVCFEFCGTLLLALFVLIRTFGVQFDWFIKFLVVKYIHRLMDQDIYCNISQYCESEHWYAVVVIQEGVSI